MKTISDPSFADVRRAHEDLRAMPAQVETGAKTAKSSRRATGAVTASVARSFREQKLAAKRAAE
jgi:hypothetical protein